MITIESLQTLMKEHLKDAKKPIITDEKKQVITGEGYDGIIAMIQNQIDVFPVIVLETSTTGTLRNLAGGFDEYSQSIWVMDYAEGDADKAEIYSKMFLLLKKIVGILRYYSRLFPGNTYRDEFKAIEWDRIPYFKRSGGPNYFGYEIVLNQEEDINLAWQPKI